MQTRTAIPMIDLSRNAPIRVKLVYALLSNMIEAGAFNNVGIERFQELSTQVLKQLYAEVTCGKVEQYCN